MAKSLEQTIQEEYKQLLIEAHQADEKQDDPDDRREMK